MCIYCERERERDVEGERERERWIEIEIDRARERERTPHWRAAMKGWSSMCKDDVLVGVGRSQYGCGRPGGAIALRHFVEAALINDSELVLGIVDVKNMHGSPSRSRFVLSCHACGLW